MSITKCPASGVVCAKDKSHNVHNNKPLLYIFVMHIGCAQKIYFTLSRILKIGSFGKNNLKFSQILNELVEF